MGRPIRRPDRRRRGAIHGVDPLRSGARPLRPERLDRARPDACRCRLDLSRGRTRTDRGPRGVDVAGRLHTGRSRNDQVATDLSLYLRDVSEAAEQGILELRGVLIERAAEHLDTVLPGYTHLQRAQPVRLAHHWLAFAEMFGRDASRQRSLRSRLSDCPLGSGA
ncbi:MAG: hypothetical protein JRE57_15035, partial [Deltaproteobacteria bacterium]|nr:hypothetical protein [Deltaproteobacteria bacterium]